MVVDEQPFSGPELRDIGADGHHLTHWLVAEHLRLALLVPGASPRRRRDPMPGSRSRMVARSDLRDGAILDANVVMRIIDGGAHGLGHERSPTARNAAFRALQSGEERPLTS